MTGFRKYSRLRITATTPLALPNTCRQMAQNDLSGRVRQAGRVPGTTHISRERTLETVRAEGLPLRGQEGCSNWTHARVQKAK